MQFNKSIYKLDAIKSTAKVFGKVASLRLSENKHYYVVEIDGVSPEEKKILKDEFCNYLLSAMN